MTEPCTQESRLAGLEATLVAISDSLKDVREILRSSIVFDERIAALRRDTEDREMRLRKLEITTASTKWQERVVWAVVAAALALLLKNYGGG